MFENFYGNRTVAETLEHMIGRGRIPQTLLLDGPSGIGKATLGRRFAARLLGDAPRIEKDDLSLPGNRAIVAEREKWPSNKRAEDPLYFASHPDFNTFPPEGPLRQVSIQQMRLLRERAQLLPMKGRYRVFLLDNFDRANEQAANSLLKTLEEPPPYLILILTVENPYDLLPTIRSRALQFHMGLVPGDEVRQFARDRDLPDAEQRVRLADGRPGVAASLNLEEFEKRRRAMLAFLQAAAGAAPFAAWVARSDAPASRSERLEPYLETLYLLLEDLLRLATGGAEVRNADLSSELASITRLVTFDWIRNAVHRIDELTSLLRRNIQKGIALDALVLELRAGRTS